MDETENIQFPISCPGCQKKLHGPVSFCPYCRFQYSNSGTLNSLNPTGDYKPVNISPYSLAENEKKEKPLTNSIQQDLPKRKEEHKPDATSPIILSLEPKRQEKETIKDDIWIIDQKPRRRGVGKWVKIAVGILIIVLLGIGIKLFVSSSEPVTKVTVDDKVKVENNKVAVKPAPSFPPSKSPLPPPPALATHEAARVLALGALRYCTDLSVAISKLPKMEKVLEAAQKLADVSPRYQDQVVLSKKTLEAVREDRDKSLMACMDKMTQLSRYGSDSRAYAVQTVNNSDLFPREKIVWGLLENYEQELSNGKELDPKRWLSDFSGKFSYFIE